MTEIAYSRLEWTDRFNEPSVEGLRQALDSETARLFTAVRKHLLKADGLGESPVWYGASWRWALEYRTSKREDLVAVLIPSPQDLQIAMPMERQFVKELCRRPMKRAMRDGLELALDPFDTQLAVWSIQPFILDDLRKLIDANLSRLGVTS
jgi:hypothetical protein